MERGREGEGREAAPRNAQAAAKDGEQEPHRPMTNGRPRARETRTSFVEFFFLVEFSPGDSEVRRRLENAREARITGEVL